MINTNEIDSVFQRAAQAVAETFNDYELDEKRRLEVYAKLRSERLAREAAKPSN
jgi:hypothetical protein